MHPTLGTHMDTPPPTPINPPMDNPTVLPAMIQPSWAPPNRGTLPPPRPPTHTPLHAPPCTLTGPLDEHPQVPGAGAFGEHPEVGRLPHPHALGLKTPAGGPARRGGARCRHGDTLSTQSHRYPWVLGAPEMGLWVLAGVGGMGAEGGTWGPWRHKGPIGTPWGKRGAKGSMGTPWGHKGPVGIRNPWGHPGDRGVLQGHSGDRGMVWGHCGHRGAMGTPWGV